MQYHEFLQNRKLLFGKRQHEMQCQKQKLKNRKTSLYKCLRSNVKYVMLKRIWSLIQKEM